MRPHQTAPHADRRTWPATALTIGALAAALISGCGPKSQTSASTAPAAAHTPAVTGSSTPAIGQSATAKFPPDEIAKFRVIVEDVLGKVNSGDQAGAKARITDLETVWDTDQAVLQPLDKGGWTVVDGQIDNALKAVRASKPDPATETQALRTLLTTLK